jgi:hypothetical protein
MRREGSRQSKVSERNAERHVTPPHRGCFSQRVRNRMKGLGIAKSEVQKSA